mgnify:CR=1 FL=1
MIKINLKEADSVIKAIEGGITPRRGIQHLLVGRNNEVQEIVKILDKITEGDSEIKFWVGDFGSGKSFMLRTIESIALQKNFAVSTVDLNPTRRFYSTDGKSKALYSEIIDNIAVQTAQNGRAINTIIERRYVKKEKKAIVPTELGEIVTDLLLKYFENIFNVKFTANIEEEFDIVEEGKEKWKNIITNFYKTFEENLGKATDLEEKIEIKDEESDIDCDKCGRKMVYKIGRFGRFLACSRISRM